MREFDTVIDPLVPRDVARSLRYSPALVPFGAGSPPPVPRVTRALLVPVIAAEGLGVVIAGLAASRLWGRVVKAVNAIMRSRAVTEKRVDATRVVAVLRRHHRDIAEKLARVSFLRRRQQEILAGAGARDAAVAGHPGEPAAGEPTSAVLPG